MGNDWVGIALAGPYSMCPRPVDEQSDFKALIAELNAAWRASFGMPLHYWCRHSDLSRQKKDPGKGFGAKFLEGTNDWPAIMAALDQAGYSGWGIAEQPGGGTPEGLKDLADRMDKIFAG